MPGSQIPTALDGPRDGQVPARLKLLDDVETHGFHIMVVQQSLAQEHGHRLSAADEERASRWSNVPDWSYTIGLYHSYGHPEIVAFALGDDIIKELCWDLARQIQAGRTFAPGMAYKDVLPSFEGQRCAFETVSPAWIPSLLGFARWFYRGTDFPVLQYLWPDRFGRFAWEKEATETILAVQPVLSEPPADEDAPPRLRTAR